jgi:hypothetical protein
LLLRGGDDKVSEEAGRTCVAPGRLAADLLVVLRTAGRDFDAVRGLDVREDGFVADLRAVPGFAAELAVLRLRAELELVPATVADPADVVRRVVRERDALDFGRADEVRGFAADRELDAATTTGFADDIDLAAALSALAAVDMAFVAVFIDFMAEDIVLADAFAFVAAAVIFDAADVTLVAADDTVLAAVAGVAWLRLAELRERDAVEPELLERDAVDRDAEPRVDRDAVLRLPDFAAVLRVDRALVLRVVLGLLELLVSDIVKGRRAVPPDALRLTDLLLAVLAELRRLAARVLD